MSLKAHDSISSDFRAPFKNILDTLTDLAKGSLSQQEVECIDIVWSEDIPWRAGRGDEAEELQCFSLRVRLIVSWVG